MRRNGILRIRLGLRRIDGRRGGGCHRVNCRGFHGFGGIQNRLRRSWRHLSGLFTAKGCHVDPDRLTGEDAQSVSRVRRDLQFRSRIVALAAKQCTDDEFAIRLVAQDHPFGVHRIGRGNPDAAKRRTAIPQRLIGVLKDFRRFDITIDQFDRRGRHNSGCIRGRRPGPSIGSGGERICPRRASCQQQGGKSCPNQTSNRRCRHHKPLILLGLCRAFIAIPRGGFCPIHLHHRANWLAHSGILRSIYPKAVDEGRPPPASCAEIAVSGKRQPDRPALRSRPPPQSHRINHVTNLGSGQKKGTLL